MSGLLLIDHRWPPGFCLGSLGKLGRRKATNACKFAMSLTPAESMPSREASGLVTSCNLRCQSYVVIALANKQSLGGIHLVTALLASCELKSGRSGWPHHSVCYPGKWVAPCVKAWSAQVISDHTCNSNNQCLECDSLLPAAWNSNATRVSILDR